MATTPLTATYSPLITVAQLQALQQSSPLQLMVFDCSFELAQPAAGAAQFAQAHIAGAIYANLDKDLSAPHGALSHGQTITATDLGDPASGGRHPLPSRERFAVWLSQVGFRNDMQAVVYDRNGVNYAGRLWWMLKWAGHDAVAVLDGGLQAWQAAGGAIEAGESASHFQSNFELRPALRTLKTAAQVQQALGAQQTVVDARAPARYRGEVEPLDPVAGHIPGALNRLFTTNIGPDGRFKPAAELRAEFDALLAGHDPQTVVHQCGSGVSALPNLIAMEIAGYAPTALFAGSWSEWCSDPSRPVEKG
ncbi:thiosulfate/3-mercaptopyruvate sulfurtransferase [Comamonas sp. BIGb0152]|uniref:sulfurtransferase n=1 Tax=Comamonas sp. BIGb0152 TaxID=2940601 RepID=UPI002169C7D6|nr:sulfurtransferase [Comamonas sp. BIGb0152]MCS4295670.1 thiosulfate/3-mercaptopyruvate sulfurtransferase [Comamonas sp. BIGb0152]